MRAQFDGTAFKRAQDGDARSLDALYRAFAPAVVQYLRVRGVDDPEGSCHDVFLGVIPQLRTVNGGIEGFRSLLFTVAHARMVDYFRRRSTAPATTEYLPEADTRTTPSAEEAAVATLAASRVETLLQELGADQREVILLRVVGGLSIEETAKVMRRSSGAVKQLQRRGLQALRVLLEPAEGE